MSEENKKGYCDLLNALCKYKCEHQLAITTIEEIMDVNENYKQQLQTAKEGSERQHELRLKSERDWDKREKQWIAEAEKAWKSQSSEYAQELEHTIRLRDEQIQTLTQQNKQMLKKADLLVEALEKIINLEIRLYTEHSCYEMKEIAQQALNGVK